MNIKYIFITILILLVFHGMVVGAANIEIDQQKELILDFKGSKIRVETWPGNGVKIDTTYLVRESYNLNISENVISFDKEKHLEKYPDDLDNNTFAIIPNEVFFVIKVPENTVLNISAEYVNIKNGCWLKSLTARNARIRGSKFVAGFTGRGEKVYIRDSVFLGQKVLDYKKINLDNKRGFWRLIRRIVF